MCVHCSTFTVYVNCVRAHRVRAHRVHRVRGHHVHRVRCDNDDVTRLYKSFEIMKKYFANVEPKPAKTISISKFSSHNYVRKRIFNSIVLKETDPYELFSLISLLDSKKAVGHCGISCKIVKIFTYLSNTIQNF